MTDVLLTHVFIRLQQHSSLSVLIVQYLLLATMSTSSSLGEGERRSRFRFRRMFNRSVKKKRKESFDTTVSSCDSDGAASREFQLEADAPSPSEERPYCVRKEDLATIDSSERPLSKATSILLKIQCDEPCFDASKECSALAVAASRAIQEENEAARAMEESRERAFDRWHNNQCAAIVIEESDDEEESLYEDASLRARREALLAQQQLLGESHPDVLFMLENLGRVHYRRGNYQEAQRVFAESRRRSLFDVAQHRGTLRRHFQVPQF